jgi:hypothetical protein
MAQEKVEKAKIKLPKKEGETEQVVVLNGVAYQIQRGVEVEVPVAVKEILENADLI